jgi:hypothetical protein
MPGTIIYKGPSKLDGAPIFVTAIHTSSNRKTGNLVQTYIMRSDMDPREANKLGEDVSICGDCELRGTPTLDPARKLAEGRVCYVRLDQGVLNVWRAFQRGRYPLADAADCADIGRGRFVRLGTYGDPAAVPTSVWRKLLQHAAGHTGYTHNAAPGGLCMTSADNLAQAQTAWAQGKRTFRIIRLATELQRNEVLCPASAEAGFKSTCIKCRLCNGDDSAAKSVAIVAHGTGRLYV